MNSILHFGSSVSEAFSAQEWANRAYDIDGIENKYDKFIFGNKGANLAFIAELGFPVPPGFIIPIGHELLNSQAKYENILYEAVDKLGQASKKIIGDAKAIMLLSVRSGSPYSMPGMMDTILNIGINRDLFRSMLMHYTDKVWIYDCYQRFLYAYSVLVYGLSADKVIGLVKHHAKTIEDREHIVKKYENIIMQNVGSIYDDAPIVQLSKAIASIAASWANERAVYYRKMHDIDDKMGTAVIVQNMVFGNKGSNSATGVIFSRDPIYGSKKPMGEYIINAQGEDIVSGTKTPYAINSSSNYSLQHTMPQNYNELLQCVAALEKLYGDMQDVEFTIEDGRLWILQTRAGKRTPHASIKIAVDMVNDGIINEKQALLSINPNIVDKILYRQFKYTDEKYLRGHGLPASHGAAVGVVALSAEYVQECAKQGKSTILVRNNTSPEDLCGMHMAEGILTMHGGSTSHAAVVARAMGKPCIVGAKHVEIDLIQACIYLNGDRINQGEYISIDGDSGAIYSTALELAQSKALPELDIIMNWASKYKTIKVFANADCAEDAINAIRYGAEGIGLCRTEHMFFNVERLSLMRAMIISKNVDAKKHYLEQLYVMQVADFSSLFSIMHNKTVTIRLLDPPLHEFLPNDDIEIEHLANNMGIAKDALCIMISSLRESNAMLGKRGCRIGILHPEIYEMQIRAIFQAFCESKSECKLDIMIPFTIMKHEIAIIKGMIKDIASQICTIYDKNEIPYKIGTMIEIPRAALLAYELAPEVDFFSFGTNDLTQTTMGLSRDDVSEMIRHYVDNGLFTFDPFSSIDVEGVGILIKHAISNGNSANASLTTGICGEHGADPESIKFFISIGVDYISCSPNRIPIALLSAAQCAINRHNLGVKYHSQFPLEL